MYDPEKHHRRSIRLKNHNYDLGFYYVTICCENRVCILGKIRNKAMILNRYGEIAQKEWLKTAEIRSNIKLHEFVLMPNHIHGILEITNCGDKADCIGVVGNRNAETGNLMSDISPKCATLPIIIRAYKSAVSKQMHELGFVGQIWQRNYYEHFIRNEQSYQAKSQYIIDNPANWNEDEFYIEL